MFPWIDSAWNSLFHQQYQIHEHNQQPSSHYHRRNYYKYLRVLILSLPKNPLIATPPTAKFKIKLSQIKQYQFHIYLKTIKG